MDSITKKFNLFLKSNVFYIIGIILLVIIWGVSSDIVDNEFHIPKVDAVLNRVVELITDISILKVIVLTIVKVIVVF